MVTFVKLLISIVIGHYASVYLIKPIYETNAPHLPKQMSLYMFGFGEVFLIGIIFYLLTFLVESDY